MAADVPRRFGIALYGLAGWTAFVWGTRVKNAVEDDALSGGGKAFSIGLSVALLALGLGAVVTHVRARSTGPTALSAHLALGFAGVSVLVWLVRVPAIWLAEHTVGFKVVHTMLAVVTWVLAAVVLQTGLAVRKARGSGADAGTPGRERESGADVSPAAAGRR